MIKCSLDKIGQVEEFKIKKGIIYMIINKINGKKYIGQTIYSFIERYNLNFSRCHNEHLQRSVEKYGKENFEVLLCASNIQDEYLLNQLEFELINDYNTTNYKYGYNKKEGGFNGKLSEETRRKISNSNSGKVRTIEQRKRMSIISSKKVVIVIDKKEMMFDSIYEAINVMKNNYNIKGVRSWFRKDRGVSGKYKHRVCFCGSLYDYELYLKKGINTTIYQKTRKESHANRTDCTIKKMSDAQKKCAIIIFDNIIIIKDSKNNIVTHMKSVYGVGGVGNWFNKKKGVSNKYKNRVSFVGYYEDYIKEYGEIDKEVA